MLVVDTHAHLDEEALHCELDDVLQRAREAGVAAVITIGTTAASSADAARIAAAHDGVYAAVGIQPNYAATAAAGDWEKITELVRAPGVVALGETGLDRYWDYAPLDVQIDYFDRHLDLSQQTGLPFVVHCRDAEDDVVAQLRRASARGPLSGVMHSYAGSWAGAEACLDLGLSISFAGMLTYKKNDALRDVARRVPRDRLLVETDSPYLAPMPLRGKRNEPAWVVHTLKCLAGLHGISVEEMAEITTQNACRLFGLSLGESPPP